MCVTLEFWKPENFKSGGSGSRECVRFGSLEALGRLNVHFKSGSSRESAYMQLLRLEAPEKLHVCISSAVWKPCES